MALIKQLLALERIQSVEKRYWYMIRENALIYLWNVMAWMMTKQWTTFALM